MDTPSLRFYVKYLDNGMPKTVRFGNDKTLLEFMQFCAKQGFAIVDTHIACYEVELVAPDLRAFANATPIDHMDINLAQDGEGIMGA